MRAQVLRKPGPVESSPLLMEEVEPPTPGRLEVRIKVLACGICLTDKHIIEGEIPLIKSPIIPGHQIVGIIDQLGEGVDRAKMGLLVGIPWLHSTCCHCYYCNMDLENLCDQATFTGYHCNGGYAEYALARIDYLVELEENPDPIKVAPLLCAGVVGYRSYKLSTIKPGQKLGIFGFGSAASLTIQVATNFDVDVEVYTRSLEHRKMALALGATVAEDAMAAPGRNLDAAIMFAPSGDLIRVALQSLRKSGFLAVNAIHTSPIPSMSYDLLYQEKCIKTVTNATREDAREFFDLATSIPIKSTTVSYPLEKANEALVDLKKSKLCGSAVLSMV